MMLLFDQKLTLVKVIICILMVIVISQFVEMCHLMVDTMVALEYLEKYPLRIILKYYLPL